MGEYLRKTRIERGLYQRDVAEEIGVHPSTIKNWEQSHADPALRHWPRLIAFLGFVPFEVGEALSERIRAWRTIHGVSRDALAATLGVDPSTVWRWESGETAPHPLVRTELEELLASLPAPGK